MKTFEEFVDDSGVTQTPQTQMPPTGTTPQQNPPVGNHESPEAAAELETLTNDVRRAVDRMFAVVKRHNLNKQKAMMLLQSIIASIANEGGLTNSNVRQASTNAMRTNGEPTTVPQQPTAV